MKTKTLSILALAAFVAAPAVSMAQDRDDHRGDDHRMEQHDERGAGPHHEFHRGDRLPNDYRGHEHEVDWRAHHLHEPPAGYHWVQSGDDFVLAAVATGVITDILLNN